MRTNLLRLTCTLQSRLQRDDRGQTSSEYLGIVGLVGAIIVAIFGLGLDDTIADALESAVDTIVNAGG